VKLQDHLSYPPRMMRRERAAAYLDISPAQLDRFVADGVLPKPTRVKNMLMWDRTDLDAAMDDIKALGADASRNTVDEYLADRKPKNPKSK
jgi:predicted DNA-binding transcriptional regulator AlpA